MYTHTLKKLPRNTVEIFVDIPKNTISQEYATVFSDLLKNLTLQGFRKGKVPKEVAEKNIKKEVVYEEMVRTLMLKIYEEIVKKEGLKPVISPKVELIKAKEHEDWQIRITVAEKPTVDLGDYKAILKQIKSEQKKESIWVPGKSPVEKKENEEQKEKARQDLLNKILAGLLKEATFELSDLIIDEELNRRLTSLLSDIQKIGLTVETYLKSKNLTQEELKNRFRQEIIDTYKLEFILSDLADKEKVTIGKEELQKVFETIKDPKEKEKAVANSYFYASVLRKQKTLDYLLNM